MNIADEILTPAEYEAALASDLSDAEILRIIKQSMQDALDVRSPCFRVSVPRTAAERTKEMLAKWDVRDAEEGGRLAHLKVSPKVPALEVFLVGDVVVVAEDVQNADLLTSSMTQSSTILQALLEGFQSAEPRQVDSSEALEILLWDRHPDGGMPVTMSAGEWARCGRGVIGPLMGSELEGRVRSMLPREHGPRCNGVPCYCDDDALVADGTYFDAARENHLYFIGPNLYVAESEEAALQYHRDSVVESKRKLEELRQSIIEEMPSVVELATLHINAMVAEVARTYDIRHVPENESLPDIVSLSAQDTLQTSPKSYDDWHRGKQGSVGLLRSYWLEVVSPRVTALMEASVAGERRLQEVRERLGG